MDVLKLPVPEGYFDAMAAGSPATEFFEDLKEEWSKRGYSPNDLIAVWVEQAEIDNYYLGGPNPINGHYCYISFLLSADPKRELENLRAQIGVPGELETAKAGWLTRIYKAGKPHQLGILESWEGCLTYGFVVPIAAEKGSPGTGKFKLLLTSIVPCRVGGYLLNDMSSIDDERGFQEALSRLGALAKQIPVSR